MHVNPPPIPQPMQSVGLWIHVSASIWTGAEFWHGVVYSLGRRTVLARGCMFNAVLRTCVVCWPRMACSLDMCRMLNWDCMFRGHVQDVHPGLHDYLMQLPEGLCNYAPPSPPPHPPPLTCTGRWHRTTFCAPPTCTECWPTTTCLCTPLDMHRV